VLTESSLAAWQAFDAVWMDLAEDWEDDRYADSSGDALIERRVICGILSG
jgi:hypothetical protein